jgi:hypothetical protein
VGGQSSVGMADRNTGMAGAGSWPTRMVAPSLADGPSVLNEGPARAQGCRPVIVAGGHGLWRPNWDDSTSMPTFVLSALASLGCTLDAVTRRAGDALWVARQPVLLGGEG